MLERVKDVLHILLRDSDLGDFGTERANKVVLGIGGTFLALISLVLTIFNVVMGYWFMAGTTTFLTLGFVVAVVLAGFKKFMLSRWVMAVFCAVMFSIYAITGENEGFAILWIVLIPIIGMMLLGLRTGFILSLYFQVFLIVIFYTPANAFIAQSYTETFAARFPVLYLTSFVAVTLLMCQRQGLYIKTKEHAILDALTGLLNRRRLTEIVTEIESRIDKGDLSVVMLDINRLKWTNDNLGHEAGDELIVGAADLIKQAFPKDKCFRSGGDEFVVVCERADVSENVRALREASETWKGELVSELSFSVGFASRVEHPGASYDELSKIADNLMYQDKSEYYRRSGQNRRQR